jgi:predicted RNA binding protein YcfA (HicA-like mRNA interferase family)
MRPSAASFVDVRSLLEDFGWARNRTSGSHVTFTKRGDYPIVVIVHDKRVKRGYLDDICDRLGLDEEEED